MTLTFVKAHAYGNDFLFIKQQLASNEQLSRLSQVVCDRHLGLGADGVVFYRQTADGAVMKLFNADGSAAEVSGNGVRCLGAILVDAFDPEKSGRRQADEILIETDGGTKRLTLLETDPPRYTFRTYMGEPSGLERRVLDLERESVDVVTLSIGNPQCVVLTSVLDPDRFARLGPLLATHKAFPHGTNVEFVNLESPDRARILIWERGVGPTQSSGTGSCAAGVAAAAFGGALRTLEVVSPGGCQLVDWASDGVYLTGWAEITARGEWVNLPDA